MRNQLFLPPENQCCRHSGRKPELGQGFPVPAAPGHRLHQRKLQIGFLAVVTEGFQDIPRQIHHIQGTGDPLSAGTIRTVQTLRTQYSMDVFCHEKDEASQNLVSNPICNLAACDILLYLFSSFTLYGSIEVVLAWEITMNTVAAMEAPVRRTVRQPGLPLKHMNYPGGARQMVQRLQKRGLIPEETRQQFDRLYDLRNRIHLRHANELRAGRFSKKMAVTMPAGFDSCHRIMLQALEKGHSGR